MAILLIFLALGTIVAAVVGFMLEVAGSWLLAVLVGGVFVLCRIRLQLRLAQRSGRVALKKE